MAAKIDLDESYFRDRSVVTPTGCWEWSLFRTATGYGKSHAGWTEYREQIAHRLAYRVLRTGGEPIAGEIDHLCRNRPCVNPDHLEDVDHRQNMLRAPHNSYIAPRAAQTLCVNGHPLDGFTARSGQRYCMTCKRQRSAEYRERRRHADTRARPDIQRGT